MGVDVSVCTAGPSMTHRSGEAKSWRMRRWCGVCLSVSYSGKGCFCPDSKTRWKPCTQTPTSDGER